MASTNGQLTKRMLANFVTQVFVPLDYPFDDADFLALKLKKMGHENIKTAALDNLLRGVSQQEGDYVIVTVKGPTEAIAAKRSPLPISISQPSQEAVTDVAQEEAQTAPVAEEPAQPQKAAPAKESRKGKITALHPSDVQTDDTQKMDEQPAATSKEVKAIRKDTKNAQVMELLAEPEGYTINELMEKLGWKTRSGVASVVYKFPKANGYGLEHDKNTGKYKLVFPEGVSEILWKD